MEVSSRSTSTSTKKLDLTYSFSVSVFVIDISESFRGFYFHYYFKTVLISHRIEVPERIIENVGSQKPLKMTEKFHQIIYFCFQHMIDSLGNFRKLNWCQSCPHFLSDSKWSYIVAVLWNFLHFKWLLMELNSTYASPWIWIVLSYSFH